MPLLWIITLVLTCFVCSMQAFHVDKTDKTACNKDLCVERSFNCRKYFIPVPSPLGQEVLITDPLLLQQVARDALGYLERYWDTHKPIVAAMPFSMQILSAERARKTLQFIVEVIEEDKKKGGPFRISDPLFIAENFGFIEWRPSGRQVGENQKVRLTVYVTYRVNGSYQKTSKHSFPLYRLVSKKDTVSCTKQEIFEGVLETEEFAGKVKPLVWISKDSVEQAMLQGTIFVRMPDGKLRAFNVDQNNGHVYDTSLRGIKRQKNYWFFREIRPDRVQELERRCQARKGVVLAANLYLFGLGKVMALCYKNPKTGKTEMRLAVLADTGSAFINTKTGHVDLFGGIVSNKKDLQEYLNVFPPQVDAYIMYYKGSSLLRLPSIVHREMEFVS